MIQQHPELFSKDQGMRLAAYGNLRYLRFAKDLAVLLANARGEISIEDIREAWPHSVPFLNWAGSIFKGERWECVGFVRALHPGAHGRLVRKWRLRK